VLNSRNRHDIIKTRESDSNNMKKLIIITVFLLTPEVYEPVNDVLKMPWMKVQTYTGYVRR